MVGRLNEWTWVIAQGRGWVTAAAVWAGVLWQGFRALHRGTRPAPSACIHNGAVMLTGSATVVAVCTLLHFTDLRWVPQAQRGGFLGGLTAAGWHAAQIPVHTALVFAAFAVAGYLVARLSHGPAHRAAEKARTRAVVQAQVQPLTARLQVVERALLTARPADTASAEAQRMLALNSKGGNDDER